jgi:hypothetical protein
MLFDYRYYGKCQAAAKSIKPLLNVFHNWALSTRNKLFSYQIDRPDANTLSDKSLSGYLTRQISRTLLKTKIKFSSKCCSSISAIFGTLNKCTITVGTTHSPWLQINEEVLVNGRQSTEGSRRKSGRWKFAGAYIKQSWDILHVCNSLLSPHKNQYCHEYMETTWSPRRKRLTFWH